MGHQAIRHRSRLTNEYRRKALVSHGGPAAAHFLAPQDRRAAGRQQWPKVRQRWAGFDLRVEWKTWHS
jgi:hypothetical protein